MSTPQDDARPGPSLEKAADPAEPTRVHRPEAVRDAEETRVHQPGAAPETPAFRPETAPPYTPPGGYPNYQPPPPGQPSYPSYPQASGPSYPQASGYPQASPGYPPQSGPAYSPPSAPIPPQQPPGYPQQPPVYPQQQAYPQAQAPGYPQQSYGYPPAYSRPATYPSGYPQPYGPPPYSPYAVPSAQSQQTWSIVSFVCIGLTVVGAVIFCFLPCLITGPAGIALGVIGHMKKEPLGKWAAIANGVVFGVLLLIVVAVLGVAGLSGDLS